MLDESFIRCNLNRLLLMTFSIEMFNILCMHLIPDQDIELYSVDLVLMVLN